MEVLVLMLRSSDGGENYFVLDESEEESLDEGEDGKMLDEELLWKRLVDLVILVKKSLVVMKD